MVEHHVANVIVASSNLVTRSIFFVLKKDRLAEIGKLVYVSTLRPIYNFASRIFQNKKSNRMLGNIFFYYMSDMSKLSDNFRHSRPVNDNAMPL